MNRRNHAAHNKTDTVDASAMNTSTIPLPSCSSLTRVAVALALCGLAQAAFPQAAQNTTTSYEYDANGNLTQITDPLGRVTTQSYDSLDRLVKQQLPVPAAGNPAPAISYAYDGLDQLKSVTDPRNLTTGYTVDALGNQSQLASPDSGKSAYTFDAAGNLKTKTDAKGQVTAYTYDADNRLTQITYASGAPTVFQYDNGSHALGKLTQITDASGQTLYRYGPFGRLAAKTQITNGGLAFVTSYAYGTTGNATGHLTSLTYPSGNRLNYTYDAAGRIQSIALNPGTANGGTDTGTVINLLTNIAYRPDGQAQSWAWGNSTAAAPNLATRTSDLDGRITGYPLGNPGANGLNRTVSYDAASRITAYTHTGSGSGTNAPANANQSFGYDNLDRLTSYSSYATSQAYAYDANGNRTGLGSGTSTTRYAVDAASNRLNSSSNSGHLQTRSYDANGSETADGAGISLAYNAQGRLQSATRSGTTPMQVAYTYNGLGQRVQKNDVGSSNAVSGHANYFVYDEAGHLIGEYGAGGQLIEETVYLGNTPVAVLQTYTTISVTPQGSLNIVTTIQPYYVYADQLDAPRVITRASDNTIVWRWDGAAPFGNTLPTGTLTYNQRFPGQYYDQESGLFYNGFRDYDPSTGRYVESDPIGLFGGINTYAYVMGNPLTRGDPTGLDWTEMVQAVKDVGVTNAVSARNDADTAILAARMSGLSGQHNGPADAYRHCVWSCLMTKHIGGEGAKKIGDNHEDEGDRHGQPKGERAMDTANNGVGRSCGGSGSKKTCQQQCMDKYLGGGLFGVGGTQMPGPSP